MKIAIPIVNGELNGHFGHTQEFYIFEVENNAIIKEETITPPPHEPGVYPKWLADMGVTDVIAAGMGQMAISLFTKNKINVFVGVQVKAPKDLVIDLINGVIETSDNTCSH
ncbi:MAG: ATPase [Bacteroidales bacterium]|nr:ATPase [Bacteroidales bacterium]